MRLMIISVIAFGLAAIAMLVADGRVTRSLGIASLWGGDSKQIHFKTQNWSAKQSSKNISIPVPQGSSKTMVGFPSYSSLKFALPQHTEILSGRFILEFTLQLPASGGGSFRIMIDNEKRAEFLLDPTESKYRVIIDLNDREIHQRFLNLSLSVDGYGDGGECPDDRARISIIEISQKSRLELKMAEVITNPVDAVLLAGNPIRIGMQKNTSQSEQEQFLIFLQTLKQHNISYRLIEKEKLKNEVAIILDPKAREPRFNLHSGNIVITGQRDISLFLQNRLDNSPSRINSSTKKVTLTALGLPNFARQFRHEIKWRTEYHMKDMPLGHSPTKLNLDIFTSMISDQSNSLLSIIQNDELLFSGHIKKLEGNKEKNLTIPLHDSALKNSLEIHVQTNEPRIGVCNPGREGFAQVLKSSALFRFKPISKKNQESLPSQLLDIGSLQFRIPHTLTASEYNDAVEIIAPIIPMNMQFFSSKRSANSAIVTILPAHAFKREIKNFFLNLNLNEENNTQKKSLSPAWISVNRDNLKAAQNQRFFEPLSKSLTTRLIAERRAETIVVIQFPTASTEPENG